MQRWIASVQSCKSIVIVVPLQADLYFRQKSEDNLAMAESELDKHTNLVTELTKKIDELQVKADEAARLKDQVDECVILISSGMGKLTVD